MNQYILENFLVSAASNSRSCDPNNVLPQLCNGINGATDIPGFIQKLMVDVGGVIGLLVIAVVVYGGFRMVTANGDKTQIEKAKKILQYAILGFVIAVLAYAGVVAVENFIGVNNIDSGSTTPQNPLGYANLKDFVVAMIKQLMLIIGSVSLFVIILNGFRYVTSRGDKEQIDKAKKGLTWAVIGIGVSLLAYTIVSAVAKLIS